jgi:hypothetical protein
LIYTKFDLTEGTVTEPKIFLKTTIVRPIITSSVAHSTILAASPATKAMSTGGFVKHQKRNNSPRDDVEALT